MHPLYAAIREYLEIDPRIKVLNERCRVFLDLAEILSDSIADSKMSAITWIIIVLIIVSILVTVTEVVLRFAMLSKAPPDVNAATIAGAGSGPSHAVLVPSAPPLLLDGAGDQEPGDDGLSDLEILARALGIQSNASLSDVKRGIVELRRHQGACVTPLVDGPQGEQEI